MYSPTTRRLDLLIYLSCGLACGDSKSTGNYTISSAGDGIGWFSVALVPGDGVDGLDPGKNTGTTDGWQVQFNKLIVVIGDIGAVPTTGDVSVDFADGDKYIVNLSNILGGRVSLDSQPASPGVYDSLDFASRRATSIWQKTPSVSEADADLMVKGGYSIYIDGTISDPAGRSCSVEDPTVCEPSPVISFQWGLTAETSYSGCPGFTLEPDDNVVAALTIPGDLWFLTGFATVGTPLRRRAQWVADADLNRDGVTTLDELAAIKASLLFRPELGYDLSGSPIRIESAYDFLEAQVRTLGLVGPSACRVGKSLDIP